MKWVVRRVASTSQSLSFRLHRRRKAPLLLMSILIKQGKPFLGSFTKPLAWPKQIVSMPSGWLIYQKLSHQLRAAEDRIAELEAEVGMYQEKADRAEQWLHRVYTEIEDRFLRQDDGRRGSPQGRQGVRASR